MKALRRFSRNNRGEAYVDVIITLLVIIVFVASLMALFPIFTAQQSLNSAARQVARTVEITGKAGTEVQEVLDALGTEPDSIGWDTTWFDESEKKIQLKTQFTVTLTKEMSIKILTPAAGGPIGIPVTIRSTATGISEVYWK